MCGIKNSDARLATMASLNTTVDVDIDDDGVIMLNASTNHYTHGNEHANEQDHMHLYALIRHRIPGIIQLSKTQWKCCQCDHVNTFSSGGKQTCVGPLFGTTLCGHEECKKYVSSHATPVLRQRTHKDTNLGSRCVAS